MRAGKLDRLIEIQRMAETIDVAGTITRGWSTLATLRAELVNHADTETDASFGEIEMVALALRSRFFPGVTTADRVLFDGAAHNIKGIVEIGRRRGLELRVERVK